MEWTPEHLATAVGCYLVLLENQRTGGSLSPDVAVRAVADRTGRSERDVRRVMVAASWLLEEHGAKSCRAFRPLCNVSAETLVALEGILSRDWKMDRAMHRKPWSRSELKVAVACYREMCRD